MLFTSGLRKVVQKQYSGAESAHITDETKRVMVEQRRRLHLIRRHTCANMVEPGTGVSMTLDRTRSTSNDRHYLRRRGTGCCCDDRLSQVPELVEVLFIHAPICISNYSTLYIIF